MNNNRRRGGIAEVSAIQPIDSLPGDLHSTLNDEAQDEFARVLKVLSSAVKSEDVKQREGWRDRHGIIHFVDYVEWHLVADLLDRLVPTWSHSVRGIVQIGSFVAATAAITIGGITREGIGTGPADSETGIKKAEHDALKRAAVKFGVARDLYRDEDRESESPAPSNSRHSRNRRVSNPKAATLNELVTPKQLFLIRRLAEQTGHDPEAICREVYQVGLEEITRRAASALIDRLQSPLPHTQQ